MTGRADILRGAARPVFKVTVTAHAVGRHELPDAVFEHVGALDEVQARAEAIRLLYGRTGTPHLRRFMRESWAHTRATLADLP